MFMISVGTSRLFASWIVRPFLARLSDSSVVVDGHDSLVSFRGSAKEKKQEPCDDAGRRGRKALPLRRKGKRKKHLETVRKEQQRLLNIRCCEAKQNSISNLAS